MFDIIVVAIVVAVLIAVLVSVVVRNSGGVMMKLSQKMVQ